MHEQRLERKKKEVDIFIGGLAKDAVEDDILKVFGAFGEIQSVRIVKSQTTQKSKGFAFIRYATAEAAKKALTELKDGTEVKGKRVGISASQDNDTLYLGNICKSWSKDQVVETLKGFGVEGVEHLLLPDDPNNEGKSKGFAFLEFSSHSDAMAAFQRLRKPDAVLGCDRSAKVSFAQTPINPSEELLLQVKTVYIENVPASWDEGTIKRFCEQYGKIEKVQVFRKNHTGKKKEFAFVEFASRESALVCVEGINNSQIGEGDVKVSANLAKPLNKGRLAKQGIRGGFKIRKYGEATNKTGSPKKVNNKKSKAVLIKENAYPKKFGNKPSSFQSKGTKRKNGPPMARPIIIRDKKHGRRGSDNFKERPLKKSRGNHDFRPRPSKGFGNQRVGYAGHPTVHPTVHTPRYATNATSYSGYGHAGASGSNLHHSDLEPHAGYLPARNIPTNYGYEQRRPSTYISHQRGGAAFAGAPTVTQTSYPGYTNYAGYQAGYAYPPPNGAYPGSSGPYPPRRAYY
uniref:RRM domain-containing protein n=1 Tax=Ananas comosus var. bracteatus TaxID=296719 RepID=A0A6V7QMC6_ANACO|nr:unnamed protein product [Ananas comosus var. bracteatus]